MGSFESPPQVSVWTFSLGHPLLSAAQDLLWGSGIQRDSPSCEFCLRDFPKPFVQMEDLCEFCFKCSNFISLVGFNYSGRYLLLN